MSRPQGTHQLTRIDIDQAGKEHYALVRAVAGIPAEQWPDERVAAVWEMYGKEARSVAQLGMFLSISHSVGLNPALNEIWLIQTNKGPKTYAGRDGFLKSASRFHGTMYGGIESGVVYPEDKFAVEYSVAEDGKRVIRIYHRWSPMERTSPHPKGAYAIVYDAEGRPTFIWRDFAKCAQMKSSYWSQNGDDAIQNRAIAAGLRRVVPLGGPLLIEGEVPFDDTSARADYVRKSTGARLRDLKAKLEGHDTEAEVEEGEFSVLEDDGKPPIEDLRAQLSALCEQHRITVPAMRRWAEDSPGVPSEPEEWTKDHIIVVCQEIAASDGLDFMRAYALSLAEKISDDDTRTEIHRELLNVQERDDLDPILERLLEDDAS